MKISVPPRSVIILSVILFPMHSFALPSKEVAINACSSIVQRMRLDPVISGMHGDDLTKIAINDCLTIIGEADGDPKVAKETATKLKKAFGRSMWDIVGSPYTSQMEKSMAVNIEGWHSRVMNESARIASNYESLNREANNVR